ncbi:MAG TPA: GntR family transcriptional regulator [Candidatus Limnocylindria bacterium]
MTFEGKRQRGRRAWQRILRPHRQTNWWAHPADLRPVERRALSTQVADQIRRRITLGDLRPGGRLESSRTLALELGVSLPVVREGLAALSYVGLIEVRHGVGIFVARRPSAARLLRAAHRHGARTELQALRATFAVETAGAAARKRQTERRMRDLRVLLDERERAAWVGDPQDFTRADLELHSFISASAGSPIHAALERMSGTALWGDLAGKARQLAIDRDLAELHADLIDAIEERQPEAASAAAAAIAAREASAGD